MRFIAFILLGLAAQPASAGLRATYNDEEGKKMVVEVADNGDARITPDGAQQYGILRGGELYAVGVEGDVVEVARVKDVAAALDQVMPPVFKQIFSAPGAAAAGSKMRIEPKGKRMVLGREGLVYAAYGMDDGKPGEASELVVSADPALKPVGRALEEFMVGSTVMVAGFIGPAAAEIAGDMRTVFALGTPLDMGGKMKLVALETAAIPAAATQLPAAPQTPGQILAGMKKSMAARTEASAGEPGPKETGAQPER